MNSVVDPAVESRFDILCRFALYGIDRFIDIDLGDVYGLDYYTGMTFKIYGYDLGFPIGSGGRYDSLMKNFGFDEAAVGFQLSLDRLAQVVPQLEAQSTTTERLFASQDLKNVFHQAQQLRAEGKRVEITTNIAKD